MPAGQNFTLLKKCRFNTKTELLEALLIKRLQPSLSALNKDTTSELSGLFSTTPLNAERQAGKLWIPFFKLFGLDSTRGLNPKSTDCKADALTTTPSRRISQNLILVKTWFYISAVFEKDLSFLPKFVTHTSLLTSQLLITC